MVRLEGGVLDGVLTVERGPAWCDGHDDEYDIVRRYQDNPARLVALAAAGSEGHQVTRA